jgi:methylenetetrahydrofolate dehydrogenase (NADP+)/methenyltetrahydrofolate cyclohydrolase
VQALKARGITPGLAVILVGDDPASAGLCAQQGQGLRARHRPAFGVGEVREAELLARIAALNADPAIHGILVQMPLPKHMTRTR